MFLTTVVILTQWLIISGLYFTGSSLRIYIILSFHISFSRWYLFSLWREDSSQCGKYFSWHERRKWKNCLNGRNRNCPIFRLCVPVFDTVRLLVDSFSCGVYIYIGWLFNWYMCNMFILDLPYMATKYKID